MCVLIFGFFIITTMLLSSKTVESKQPIVNLTSDEINLIERVVECEVRGNNDSDYQAKLAVANVILNRYNPSNTEFPNTIEGVIFQKNQFTPVKSKIFYTIEVSDVTKKAVADALNGARIIDSNVCYFCTIDCSNKKWFDTNLSYYNRIGPHDFYAS